jgi:hypothetical protein
MSEPQTPNIRLRAGGSGPFVDLGWQLRNLFKNVQVRRFWYDLQTPALDVTVPTHAPGALVASVDVEWSEDDASITGSLNYLALLWMQIGSPGVSTAYPIDPGAVLNMEPAGGAAQSVREFDCDAIPANPGQDYNFNGDVTGFHLAKALSFTNFVQGTNRIWLGAANNTGTQTIQVKEAALLVAELATAPNNIIVTP